MKKLIFIPLLILITSVMAQESNTLLFRVGFGTYSMKSQKQFQQDFLRSSKIPFVNVHNFPAFPTFGGSLGIRVSPSASIGLWAEYASTGGRLHYKDYSGHAVLDQVLKTFQAGPFIQYNINKSTSWPIYLTLHSSIAPTNEHIRSEVKVGNQTVKESYKLNSLNYGLRPGFMMSRQVSAMVFQLGIGTELQLHGTLKENKDLYFKTSDGKEMVAQWDGLRLTFGIGFKL